MAGRDWVVRGRTRYALVTTRARARLAGCSGRALSAAALGTAGAPHFDKRLQPLALRPRRAALAPLRLPRELERELAAAPDARGVPVFAEVIETVQVALSAETLVQPDQAETSEPDATVAVSVTLAPFAALPLHAPALFVQEMSGAVSATVLALLRHVEAERGCSALTRNAQRAARGSRR